MTYNYDLREKLEKEHNPMTYEEMVSFYVYLLENGYSDCLDEMEETIAKMEVQKETGKRVGRPSKGVTKKVSVTMDEDLWTYVDSFEGSRSEFFAKCVEQYKRGELE